jgi:heptaprenyl diphosphate synthase
MLSRISIRQDLKIPGGFGELIGESFRFFAVIMDSRQRITRKNLTGDIDALMLELSEDSPASPGMPPAAEGTTAETPAPKQRTTAAGFIILALVVFLSWLPLIFMFVLSARTIPSG